MEVLEFDGSNCFRQRLILATLTRRRIVINRFRDVQGPVFGVQKFEVTLLKLLEKLTNGSVISIDQNGTRIAYKPGILYGGELDHFCGLDRCISYYLELLLPLAPFCKVPVRANLRGITNDQIDPSVDAIRQASLPLMKQFFGGAVSDEDLLIKVISRGLRPDGGGHVLFGCPIRKVLKPVQLMNPGKVKRIRGMAFAARCSPQIANRMVETAKGELLRFIPDIYIYTDHLKGKNSGKSPGFGVTLVAETTESTVYVGEAMSNPGGTGEISLPEDVARRAVSNLLNDVYRGGCVCAINQPLAVLLMTFIDRDLSKVLLGPLSPYTIQLLRHIQLFTSVTFKLETLDQEDHQDMKVGAKKIVAACVGLGYTNLSKTVK